MLTHEQMVAKWMENPEFKAEYDRIEREEMPMLDMLLNARKEVGMTQAQIAEKMGTQAPAVARLERALATGNMSPSIATLQKYAAALGKRLEIRMVS
jgi:predicted transcriptional regulator